MSKTECNSTTSDTESLPATGMAHTESRTPAARPRIGAVSKSLIVSTRLRAGTNDNGHQVNPSARPIDEVIVETDAPSNQAETKR